MAKVLELFKSWKSRYIERLEKENERLTEELRHWQNQCLMGMRMQPLPTVPPPMIGVPKKELDEDQKKAQMPHRKTFHQRQALDGAIHDRQWASDVLATSLELKRTLEESKNGHGSTT